MGNEELQRQGQIELNARLAELLGNNDAQANFEIINPIQQQKNLNGIFDKTQKKLGQERLKQPGKIPLRVLRDTINDGSLCDDDLIQEYYAGMLAGSKTSDCKDDSALPILSILRSMSYQEIYFHYVFYRSVYDLFRTKGLSLTQGQHRQKMIIFIPSLNWSNSQGAVFEELFRVGLFCTQATYIYGGVDHIKTKFPSFESNQPGGFCYAPSVIGGALFTWAHGFSAHKNRFFSCEYGDPLMKLPDGIQVLVK